MTPLERVERSGTVGAGGAGFPTHVKLSRPIEVLIANAAECEPLLHANQELLLHEAPRVLAGLLAAAEMTDAHRVVIALKAKYKEAICEVEAALTAASAPPVEIFHLPDYYPAGDEQAMVAEVTGRVVPEGGIPLDVGVVVANVETLANVADALEGRPVIDKWVTVTGAVRKPTTFRVPVGTPMALLVTAAGGATPVDWAILEGGPMMGRVVLDPNSPVAKTTGGVIVLPRSHPLIARPLLDMAVERRRARTACIRCARCTELCPRYLQGHDLRPHQVMQALALFPDSDPVYDQSWLCSECGLCEVFSCPMGLSPRHVMAQFKRSFGAEGRRRQKREKEYHLRPDRSARRISGKRLLLRMGLEQYDRPAPLRPMPQVPPVVTLLLRQHIGVAAVPVVQAGERVERGQLVAAVPEGKLGAPVHSSIDGTVTSVTSAAIRIEGRADRA